MLIALVVVVLPLIQGFSQDNVHMGLIHEKKIDSIKRIEMNECDESIETPLICESEEDFDTISSILLPFINENKTICVESNIDIQPSCPAKISQFLGIVRSCQNLTLGEIDTALLPFDVTFESLFNASFISIWMDDNVDATFPNLMITKGLSCNAGAFPKLLEIQTQFLIFHARNRNFLSFTQTQEGPGFIQEVLMISSTNISLDLPTIQNMYTKDLNGTFEVKINWGTSLQLDMSNDPIINFPSRNVEQVILTCNLTNGNCGGSVAFKSGFPSSLTPLFSDNQFHGQVSFHPSFLSGFSFVSDIAILNVTAAALTCDQIELSGAGDFMIDIGYLSTIVLNNTSNHTLVSSQIAQNVTLILDKASSSPILSAPTVSFVFSIEVEAQDTQTRSFPNIQSIGNLHMKVSGPSSTSATANSIVFPDLKNVSALIGENIRVLPAMNQVKTLTKGLCLQATIPIALDVSSLTNVDIEGDCYVSSNYTLTSSRTISSLRLMEDYCPCSTGCNAEPEKICRTDLD